MEQQTISIAKAGIHATLNARTSILAAANPTQGRYDITKSLRYNVQISPPIMSRFDLFFVIRDEKDANKDLAVANHIIEMHRMEGRKHNSEHFTKEQLQNFIRITRQLRPQFMKESAAILKTQYKEMRQQNKSGQGSDHAYKFTVRQLESLVRLSEAMARLHCDDLIRPQYVKEVCRLLKESNIPIKREDIDM